MEENRKIAFRPEPADGESYPPHLAWLKHAEQYRANGTLINDELMSVLILQCNLIHHYDKRPIYNATKAMFDLVCSGLLLLLCAPLFLVIAVCIKLESRGPVFFSQVRYGQFGKPFKIKKFRTMYLGSAAKAVELDNEMSGGMFKKESDPRVTRVGRFLRKTSLDELPQILNVFNGEMSLVGPRPLQSEDTATVREEHMIRFAVRPGITGLWQATARDIANGQEKIMMDCIYVNERGWSMDLKLLAKTIPVVISGKGAY